METPRRGGRKGRWKVWLKIIILGIAISLTLYLSHLIKKREKLGERGEVQGVEKKEKKAENRREGGAFGEALIASNRLSASGQGKMEVLDRKRPGSGKAGSR